MPLLINEDEALKAYVSGITVSDDKNNARQVKVWFGQPDLEVQTQTYPYITIDLVDIVMDAPRAIHGIDELPYLPEGATAPATGHSIITESPIPLVLQYQITTFARHPRHDRTMVVAMMQKFPYQFGGIEVPQDNTYRRAYLNRMLNRDRTEETKRLFSKVFDVSVESEMILSRFLDVQEVLTVNTTITTVEINQDIETP